MWVPCWCEVQALPMAGARGHLVDFVCVPLNSTPPGGLEAGKPGLDPSVLRSLWDTLQGCPLLQASLLLTLTQRGCGGRESE